MSVKVKFNSHACIKYTHTAIVYVAISQTAIFQTEKYIQNRRIYKRICLHVCVSVKVKLLFRDAVHKSSSYCNRINKLKSFRNKVFAGSNKVFSTKARR